MPKPQWTKLYLAPQTDNHDMPSYVIGLLTGETASAYILNPMLETVIDESTGTSLVPVGMNQISKTYTWRVQILEAKPEVVEVTDETMNIQELGGGLG